jgi:methionyl-tRNA formyltransferase
LTAKKPDILVVIAYGKIIPQHILDIPAIAPINVHGSLLPAYRGASPIQSVLLHDEPETGITIMGMDAGLDTGPILATSSFTLTIHTTALDIIHTFQKIGPDLLVDTIRDYAKGHLHAQTQDDSLATHTTKLSKSDGLIDPSTQSLYQINNIYRGCYLWPKAHFVRTHDDKQITVTIDSLTLNESLRDQHKDEPIWNNQHQLNPAIISLSVKPANSKTMSRKAFLAGY